MKLLLLLLAGLLLRFVNHRYTISHPKGIYYSDVSDYVTAFMYQPVINLLLVFTTMIALAIIYTIFFICIFKQFGQRNSNTFINLLHIILALIMMVMGTIYFTQLSLLYLVALIYFSIQKVTNRKNGGINKKYRPF